MIRSVVLASALGLGAFVAPAPAQPFGFTRSMVPGEAATSQAVALGDVDGDGDLDAFLGRPGQQNRFYRNDGTGVLDDATATSLPALIDFTNAVALGDVDGDGDLDAFLGNDGQSRLYRNGGAGLFTDVTGANLPALLDSTHAVALGDMDGDGDLDAFLGNYGQSRLFLNAGVGVFVDVTATNLPPRLDLTTAVALGDMDGDGDLEVLLGNRSYPFGAQNRLYLNLGSGIFADATATSLPAFLDDTQAVAIGDVDGDGDLDSLVGNYIQQDRLLLNGGTGIFADATATNLPVLLGDTRAVAFGDMEGDGDLDAYVGKSGAGYSPGAQDRLLSNDGTGVFTDVTTTNLPALNDATVALVLGDMDGDGDLDAFVGNYSQQDRLLLNDGLGTLRDVTAASVPGRLDNRSDVGLADFDGDGDLDAFAANPGWQQDRLYRNDGTGSFADVTATNLPAPLGDTGAVGVGDVDGDGDLDVFVGTGAVFPPETERLYLNSGSGVFTDATATNLPVTDDHTMALALGDVDGDGDLDALVGNMMIPTNAMNRLFLNGGSGLFTLAAAGTLPYAPSETEAVEMGDVDGDGDLDAWFGNLGQDRLFLNNGTGAFVDVTGANLPVLLEETTAVALGDLDGDGDLDAFIGNGNSGSSFQDRLLLNSGAGIFADFTASNLPVALDDTRSLALGDVDGDGDLDALVGNYGQSRLLVNAGAGALADLTAIALPALFDITLAVAFGDLDGDGDLDAYAGVAGQDRIYTNLGRQLAWRGIPRAGKPLTLDLSGPALGTWLLAASAGSSNIPIPPFGTLRLLPATLFIVAGGVLDPQGRASVPLAVPANPALLGASLYWQAVVGPPLRLTNLEVTTVTNL